MKLFGVALFGAALLFASCENKNKEEIKIATFEEVSLSDAGINKYAKDGLYNWISGDFGFTTAAAYDTTMYYNFTVSNQTSNSFADYKDQYHSAPGGAVAGNNFVVAYQADTAYAKNASLSIKYSGFATLIPGTYVTNNAYAVYAIQNGYTPARAFKDGDYFKLTFIGYLGGVKIGTKEFYLADFRDGKSLVVKEWTYVELTDLGIVDEIRCELTSTDTGDNGMNTPSYFCLDNFGAKK